uniref:Uncharacterized protein n=1 Tax=Sphaerodactylus townsendi TaxID=933632 RepID=A0ACB8ED40_9SAUR
MPLKLRGGGLQLTVSNNTVTDMLEDFSSSFFAHVDCTSIQNRVKTRRLSPPLRSARRPTVLDQEGSLCFYPSCGSYSQCRSSKAGWYKISQVFFKNIYW